MLVKASFYVNIMRQSELSLADALQSVSLGVLRGFLCWSLGAARAKLRHVTVNVRQHLWNLSNKQGQCPK